MEKTERFLSCDWGTTSFRLALVSYPDYHIIAEETSKQGIARTYDDWKKAGTVESKRLSFYVDVIRDHLSKMKKKINYSIEGLPLLISGMASSSIGMVELPYRQFPFSTDGSDLEVKTIRTGIDLDHPILIISGACTEEDVMRGEETQLVGCSLSLTDAEQLFIHPGTHSKHVVVRNGKAISFKTYMTGELFSLLSSHSILAVSVEPGHELNAQIFERGVKASLAGNLLHNIFLVRTNHLFKKLSKIENFFYLSGLLIGSELKDLVGRDVGKITLSGNETLMALYRKAFRVLGIDTGSAAIDIIDAEEATFKGQYQIYRQFSAI